MSYQPHPYRPSPAGFHPQGQSQAYPTSYPSTQNFQQFHAPPPPYQYAQYGPPAQQPPMPPQTMSPYMQPPLTAQPPARPYLRITKDEVRDISKDQVVVTVTRGSSMGLPSLFSSKSVVTIARPDGYVVGTLKFHETTSAMDFTVHNMPSKLKNVGTFTDKWGWRPIFRATTAMSSDVDKWFWKMEKRSGTLEDRKKDGQVIAKLDDGTLTFERPLAPAEFDEVLVTAVAVLERRRRDKKDGDAVEGADAIMQVLVGA